MQPHLLGKQTLLIWPCSGSPVNLAHLLSYNFTGDGSTRFEYHNNPEGANCFSCEGLFEDCRSKHTTPFPCSRVILLRRGFWIDQKLTRYGSFPGISVNTLGKSIGKCRKRETQEQSTTKIIFLLRYWLVDGWVRREEMIKIFRLNIRRFTSGDWQSTLHFFSEGVEWENFVLSGWRESKLM